MKRESLLNVERAAFRIQEERVATHFDLLYACSYKFPLVYINEQRMFLCLAFPPGILYIFHHQRQPAKSWHTVLAKRT